MLKTVQTNLDQQHSAIDNIKAQAQHTNSQIKEIVILFYFDLFYFTFLTQVNLKLKLLENFKKIKDIEKKVLIIA